MRPFGTYRLHTRTPPHVAPSALASDASSHIGWPSKPLVTSVIPTRDAIATPFHWFVPTWATS